MLLEENSIDSMDTGTFNLLEKIEDMTDGDFTHKTSTKMSKLATRIEKI